MKLVLTAVSEPSIPSITVNDVLLPIGANEAAFDDLPSSYRDQLEERHARIFEDQGVIYVVDLGTVSGTMINGDPVDSVPVVVHDGDILQFGESLDYRVQINAEDRPETSPDAEGQLLLMPAGSHQEMEPLAIERFPFLIGKNQPALAGWSERQPKAFKFLSRRHAQISFDGQLYRIEDLASTNGTWINGERKRSSTHVLNDGDIVAFGQEGVCFRVDTQSDVEQAALPEGTILVSKAESFLDIYCQSGPASAETPERPADPSGQPSQVKRGAAAAVAQRLNLAKLPLSTRIGAVTVLVGIVALVVYLFTADDRRGHILELMAQGQTTEGISLAQSYLASDPDDGEIRQALEGALKTAFIPPWVEAFRANDWTRAAQLLEQARAVMPAAVSFDWTMPLAWMADAEQFRQQTGDLQRYRLYRDEGRLELLVSGVRQPSSPPTPELRKLINAYDDLGPVYRQSLSTLRRMKHHAGTYLPAITDLKQGVDDAISADRTSAALVELEDFAERYPDIEGIQQLRREIEQLDLLILALEDGDLAGFARLEPELSFQSPVVQRYVQERLIGLPQARISAEVWREAQVAWRQGRTDRAVTLLSEHQAGAWQGAVTAQQLQWETDLAEYAALRGVFASEAPTAESAASLSRLMSRLDAAEDAWLYERVAELAQAEDEALRALASTDLDRANDAWARYQEVRGGIDSTLRLEPRVSDRFREQAGWLEEAYRHAQMASQLDAFLGPERRPSAGSLHRLISVEITRQRLALNDLSSVLEPDVVSEKLALIPEP